MKDDKRLIEDYLPIEAISAEASREKSIRKGHISTLHLWWARRPLVACRAAVYGALVPASRFVPNGASDEKKRSLGRANAAKFVQALCKYPGQPHIFEEAQRHILQGHAERLTKELKDWKSGCAPKPAWVDEFRFTSAEVTAEDIVAARAPRPRVLDMFAGGGAIPLEALRLGCEASALDLNPVAHIVELCTLVYPQKYGRSDPNARGMTGAKNANGDTTWGGLASEVRYWGDWVLKKVRAEIGDLYPLIPDPEFKGRRKDHQETWLKDNGTEGVPNGYLMPMAYLWTRTVTCKNPSCRATVPLVRQTWLCDKDKRYVALKMIATKGKKIVRFEVVESQTEKGLGFDPAGFSKGSSATCPFCGSVADSDYVKAEACARRMGQQMMAFVCGLPSGKSKKYCTVSEESETEGKTDSLRAKTEQIARKHGITVPDEPLEANPRSFDVQSFGFTHWRDLFSPRELATMVAFAGNVKESHQAMLHSGIETGRAEATLICLSCGVGRLADYLTTFCTWQPEFIKNTYNAPGLPMIMDYAEGNPLAGASGSWASAIDYIAAFLDTIAQSGLPCKVGRGSAMILPFEDDVFDAIVTDPPYYDSRSYSNLSDHFYVWHKRTVGHLLKEHFAGQLTPKKNEAIAAAYRTGGDWKKADASYEQMMQKSFAEARRVLKPGKPMICVYAHKTTAGWATLVNALRAAGFRVEEAWPVEMERKTRQNAQNTAALASSIFLVARKREGSETGNYEEQIKQELNQTVRERVETLWEMDVSGADLVIASVGAGLRAFTRYGRVEYANGEEVPAERFLAEVETVVLETILAKLSKAVGAKNGQAMLAGMDPATRFYILWRYTYGAAELDAGEAIVFANGTHVELDGPNSLTQSSRALLEKKKSKYHLYDYAERGGEKLLGIAGENGAPVSIIDVLHRLLWLQENKPMRLQVFLDEAKPDIEQLRLVAQALSGPTLRGGELPDVSSSAEQSALGKLLANWSAVIIGQAAIADRRTGQQKLFN